MTAWRATQRRKVRKAATVLPETRPKAAWAKETLAKTRGGEANVQRILDAALSVFAAEGFGGARIDAIAAQAGL